MTNLREQAERAVLNNFSPSPAPAPRPAAPRITAAPSVPTDRELGNAALQTIRSGGAVPLSGGAIIRRGADGRTYLVSRGAQGQSYSITSDVGLQQALRANSAMPLSEAQVRQAVVSARQPIPRAAPAPARAGTSTQTETRRGSNAPAGTTNNNNNNNAAAAAPANFELKSTDFRADRNEFLQGEYLDDKNTIRNPNYVAPTQNSAFGVSRTRRDQFDISQFRSSVINSDGVLPTHSFLVVFAPMPWAMDYMDTGVTATTLTMRCDNVVLPSMNLLQEQNIRRYGYGPVENVAYGVNVGDFTLQFIVDKEAQQFDFFEAWLNKIVNRDSYGGANMNPTQGPTPYEIAYKDTYACSSINVFVYDRAQNTVLEYNIYDAYPTGIQSMNMSWSEENSLMRLNVSFAFTDFRIRPKISAFNQGAGTANGRSTLTPELQAQLEEEARARALAEEQLRSAIGNQNPTGTVVIGEGNNGVPRTFGTPADTAPLVTPERAVYIPKTRNAFSQEIPST